MEYVVLNNGSKLPCMGLGSGSMTMQWAEYRPFKRNIIGRVLNHYLNEIHDKYMCAKVVKYFQHSLQCGYRLLDWSATYGRGELIKNAIEKEAIKREELYITSRVSNEQQFSGIVRESFFETIKTLGVDYLDLFLFHWPVTDHYIDTYKEMEKLYKEGYVKAIGVCNCKEHHLKKILEECEIVPAINQIEVHPLFTQKELIRFCETHDIKVMAYTPLARNDDRLRKNLILKGLCKKYNKSLAQIILRWDVQQGIIPIPRSSNPQRQAENINIFNFEISDDDMKAIDSININSRLRYDPDNVDFHQC